jgi:hypothetical protein
MRRICREVAGAAPTERPSKQARANEAHRKTAKKRIIMTSDFSAPEKQRQPIGLETRQQNLVCALQVPIRVIRNANFLRQQQKRDIPEQCRAIAADVTARTQLRFPSA